MSHEAKIFYIIKIDVPPATTIRVVALRNVKHLVASVNIRIYCFSVSFMAVKCLGFEILVGQKKQIDNLIFNSEKL